MRGVIYLLFQLLTTLAKLLHPGGGRTVIAENLILKQQLIIHSRSRQRAPNLSTKDRALLGFWSLFLNPRRITRSAIIIKPSTLLRFHNALKKRKYRLLYSPSGGSSVERLIGSVRREMLDRTFFWTATDLENKLQDYQRYYNEHRAHSGGRGVTPVESADRIIIDIN